MTRYVYQCCSGGGTRCNAFPHKISRGNGVPAKILGDRGNGGTAAFPQWRLKSRPVTQFNHEQKRDILHLANENVPVISRITYWQERQPAGTIATSCLTSRAGLRHVSCVRSHIAADFRGPPILVNILCGWYLAAKWLRISVRRVPSTIDDKRNFSARTYT